MNNNFSNNNSESNSRVFNNFIRAEVVESREGEILWMVYRQNGEAITDRFFFREAVKAMRYINILKRRAGGYVPAREFTALCQAIKATPTTAYEVTATDAQGVANSVIVSAKVASDAKRIGLARIARLWGPEAKALDAQISVALMPEVPEAPEVPEVPEAKPAKAAKPRRRKAAKAAATA